MSNMPNGELRLKPEEWLAYSTYQPESAIVDAACRKLGVPVERLEIKRSGPCVLVRIGAEHESRKTGSEQSCGRWQQATITLDV
jgi:hypothetical protein